MKSQECFKQFVGEILLDTYKYKKGRCGMIANETTLYKRPKWHRN